MVGGSRFCQVSSWVTTECTKEPKRKAKKRAGIITYFIKLAMELKSLNNLNGVMEIVAGLGNIAVKRMKKVWAV